MAEPLRLGTGVTLYVADNLDVLPDLPSGSVDLCLTSPPYANLRRDSLDLCPADYPAWFMRRAPEIMRVLKPTGNFVLNLGHVARGDGWRRSTYLYRLLVALEDLGFGFVNEYPWLKSDAVAGCFGKRCKPAHEPFYWLALTKHHFFDGTALRTPYRSRSHSGRPKSKLRNPDGGDADFYKAGGALPPDYIMGPSAGPRDGAGAHTAVMPTYVAEFFVRCGCPPGGIVLDPFAGSGTTAVAAIAQGRRCVLVERDQAHLPTIERRVREAAGP